MTVFMQLAPGLHHNFHWPMTSQEDIWPTSYSLFCSLSWNISVSVIKWNIKSTDQHATNKPFIEDWHARLQQQWCRVMTSHFECPVFSLSWEAVIVTVVKTTAFFFREGVWHHNGFVSRLTIIKCDIHMSSQICCRIQTIKWWLRNCQSVSRFVWLISCSANQCSE